MSEKDYNIGLDIGTNSVGWAVTDKKGHLIKFKGKNMWGSRLFDKGETAAARREYRSTRRRYARRKQRINQLQEIFSSEISKIDENFFIRLKESFLHKDDSTVMSDSILFDDRNYSDRNYYKDYPTIYHLRKALLDSKEKMDIRLIYLAFHHILKYRGNFLYGKGDIGLIGDDIDHSIESIFSKLIVEGDSESLSFNIDEMKDILSSINSRGNKQELLNKLLYVKDKDVNNRIKEFIKAILGYKFSLDKLFNLEDSDKDKKISFREDIDESEIEGWLGDNMEDFESLKNIYNWMVLEELLGDVDSKNANDKTISNAMIKKYSDHEKQLKMLKELIRDICPTEEYKNIFRKKDKEASYASYIEGTKKCSLEDMNKYVKKIIDKYPLAKTHKNYDKIYDLLIENKLLSKLNTTDNSAIPYQLQKVEMERIIDSQGKYYSFLKENKELLIKILESKLPYYIGPLNRSSSFAWNIPLENEKKSGKMYPWNFEEFIDIDKTAEKFIKCMTNKCTYLRDRDVLPRYSLLYSEFVLLNELNKVRVNIDGNRIYLEKAIKRDIINDIFKKKKVVKTKDLIDWIRKNPSGFLTNSTSEISIEGSQGENEFAASLSSYNDFEKIFGDINEKNFEMIEEIISWITIFEDKEILKRKIKQKYNLNNPVVERIIKLRYSGWARLSEMLIYGIRAEKLSEYAGLTIIEIMRISNYNFMQIINDNRFGFKEIIEDLNPSIDKEKIDYDDIKDLQGSPAIKRGIWETVKIIDEIVKVMGYEPSNIFMEFARDDDKPVRTVSRGHRLKKIYDEIKNDAHLYNEEVYKNLDNLIKSRNKLDLKSLYLYFIQNGKCMYTGESLSLDDLDKYEIDHIIPRSYIKDDSIENLALVIKDANQIKGNSLFLNPKIQRKQEEYWNNLFKYGLIGKKKLDNLKRTSIPDREIIGFINRQLVETRQISKHVSDLLSEVYRDTKIIAIKARLTADFREQYGFYKNRDVNDYHHAHDAFLACVIGNFIINRYPYLEEEFNVKKYISWFKKSNMHKDRKNKYGFVLATMNKDFSNDEFYWDKDAEISRIRKALNYKDCFITKKVEEQTGKFYNETIYGHKDPNAKIPLKKGLNPQKYGGYSGVNNAYFVVVEYFKNNKEIRKLVGIPIQIANMIKSKQDTLENYIIESEDIEDKSSLRILKDNIKKYQLMEYEGHQVYLISNRELQNAVQLVIDKKYEKILMWLDKKQINDNEEEDCHELMESFIEYFANKLERYYPFYSPMAAQIIDSKDDFMKFESDRKLDFIKQLITITAVNSSYGDFKKFNTKIKSTEAGRTRNRSQGGWNVDNITFIDKSITGLFERRYKL